MESYRNVTAEQLLQRTRIPIEVLDTADDLAWDMARVMLETVRRNNAAARQTVLIVPVGPVGQYRRFARLANLEKLDLSGLVLINMDEYLDENGRWICQDDPLSFRGFMQREFYDLLQGRSVVPPQNRIFPDPDAPQRVQEKIDGIMPGVLSIGVLFIYYYLISKKHVSVAKLVFFTIVIALLCAAIGLF